VMTRQAPHEFAAQPCRKPPLPLLPAALLQESANPVETLRELVLRLCVRKPDESLATLAERGARQHGDPRFRQQPLGQLTLAKPRSLDVRECIERALRLRAAHSGKRIQTIDHQVP